MHAIVTAKGQITIPALLRRIFNIKPGNKVIFSVSKDGILIKKSSSLTERLYGAAARGRKVRYIPLSKAREIAGRALAEKYKPKR